MNEDEFIKRVTRLERVASILEKFPPEIRAAAFLLLKDYVEQTDNQSPSKSTGGKGKDEPPEDTRSKEKFFGEFAHDKPSDNVRLIAAFLYQEHGVQPFSVEDVRQIANDVGITIPDRVDMTLVAALEHSKKLFTRAGKGNFKVTVHGERYLKNAYSISKGTKKRIEASQ